MDGKGKPHDPRRRGLSGQSEVPLGSGSVAYTLENIFPEDQRSLPGLKELADRGFRTSPANGGWSSDGWMRFPSGSHNNTKQG